MLRAIDRDIKKISELTTGAFQLEPLRTKKKIQTQSVYWQNVREQAQRLFDSLSLRLHPCSCNQPHQANLQLDFHRGEYELEGTRFTFLLTFERSAGIPQALPWNWKDVEIESACLPTQ